MASRSCDQQTVVSAHASRWHLKQTLHFFSKTSARCHFNIQKVPQKRFHWREIQTRGRDVTDSAQTIWTQLTNVFCHNFKWVINLTNGFQFRPTVRERTVSFLRLVLEQAHKLRLTNLFKVWFFEELMLSTELTVSAPCCYDHYKVYWQTDISF